MDRKARRAAAEEPTNERVEHSASAREATGLRARGVAGCLAVLRAAISCGVGLVRPAAAQMVIDTSGTQTIDLTGPVRPVSITAGTTIAVANGPVIAATGTPWTLGNAGTVRASNGVGIDLAAGGAVSNQAGGSVTASSYGVRVNQAAGRVSNSGAIAAGYDGISLNRGGSVINHAGGTISGGHIGVYTGNRLGQVVSMPG